MKRSEMIMDLATELIYCDSSINYAKAKEIAGKMLSRAEENGMKAPHVMIPGKWQTPNDNCKWEDE